MDPWKTDVTTEGQTRWHCQWPGADCTSILFTKSRLRAHANACHNALDTVCILCKAAPRFTRTDNLLRHLANTHPGKPAKNCEVLYAVKPTSLWKTPTCTEEERQELEQKMKEWRDAEETVNANIAVEGPEDDAISLLADNDAALELDNEHGEITTTQQPAPKRPRLHSVITVPVNTNPMQIIINNRSETRAVELPALHHPLTPPSWVSHRHTPDDRRAYAEKQRGYDPALVKLAEHLQVSDIKFEEGRSPVLEILHDCYHQKGLYQVFLRPSFMGDTAKGLFVTQTRLRLNQHRRPRVVVKSQMGIVQDEEMMLIWRKVVPDMVGIHPSDILRVQYLQDIIVLPPVLHTTGSTQTDRVTVVETATQAEQPCHIEDAPPAESCRKMNTKSPIEDSAPLATRVKAYGCYPLLPAGRRDWTSASISINGVSEIQWPPVGWMDLSPQNRLWAAQTVIAIREMKRNDGLFPDGNIAKYVDLYRWLILNDTQKVRRDGPTPIRMTQDLQLPTRIDGRTS